jgi:hypothetical protein
MQLVLLTPVLLTFESIVGIKQRPAETQLGRSLFRHFHRFMRLASLGRTI